MYSGPTKVTADKYTKDGKQYVNRLVLPLELKNHPGRLKHSDKKSRMSYQRTRSEYLLTPVYRSVELTPELKNADMNIVPHPYMDNMFTDKTVVLLDPTSETTAELLALHSAGEDVNQMLHDGYFNIGNVHIDRQGPNDLMIVDVNWRNTL